MLLREFHKDRLVVKEVYIKNFVISVLATKALMLMLSDT